MKKIFATLTAFIATMTMCVFAERYVSANDLDLGVLTEDKALEDGFTIKATTEKSVEITKQGSDQPNKVGDEVFTQRIKFGSGNATCRNVSFSAKAGEKVTVYGKSSSNSDSRVIAICKDDGTEVGTVSVAPAGSDISSGTVSIPEAGNYYVTSKKNTIYIYEIIIE